MAEQTITIEGVDYQGLFDVNADLRPRKTSLNFSGQNLNEIYTYPITVYNITRRQKGLFVSEVGGEPNTLELINQFEPAAIVEGGSISFDVHILGKQKNENVTVTLILEDDFLFWGSGVTVDATDLTGKTATMVFNGRVGNDFKQTVTVNTKQDAVNATTDTDNDGSIKSAINLSAENQYGNILNEDYYNYGAALVTVTINDRVSVGEVKARFVVGQNDSKTLKENSDHNIGTQTSNKYYTKRAERITIILSWDQIPAPLDEDTPLNIITTVSADNIQNAQARNRIAGRVKLFPNSEPEADLDFDDYSDSYSHEWTAMNWDDPFRIDMALPADPSDIDDETFMIKIVSALKTGTSYTPQSIDSVGITHQDTTNVNLVVNWMEALTFTEEQRKDGTIDLVEMSTIDVTVNINPTFQLKTNTKKTITVRASIPDSTTATLKDGTIDGSKASNQNLTWESPSLTP